MRSLRSFVRSFLLRMRRARRRLPNGLDVFVVAGLRHGLAVACFGTMRGAFERWPAAMLLPLLGALVVWALPRARSRTLVQVGDLLVRAGAVLVVALGALACVCFAVQALRAAFC